ncbi:hypothetical protein SETIT_9G204300v2 [Setaria italica]|uniref:Uncharacterized protein n=1 Tax=Setaria italica TaxID=4555 RepID=A0A368SIR8_SETIT|nr:hypothetical protein SETIT_9G204300v2 [Setaria italica]
MHVGYIITLGQLQRYKTAGSCKPEGKRDDQAQQTASSFVVREKTFQPAYKLKRTGPLETALVLCKLSTF